MRRLPRGQLNSIRLTGACPQKYTLKLFAWQLSDNAKLCINGSGKSCIFFFSSSKTGQVVLTSVSFDEADFANPLDAMLSGDSAVKARIREKGGVCPCPAVQLLLLVTCAANVCKGVISLEHKT